jgi:hypothetical protein
VGTFTADDAKLTGLVRIHWYAGQRQTLWGDQADVIDTTVSGQVSANTIVGKLTRPGYSDRPFRMTKRAELLS